MAHDGKRQKWFHPTRAWRQAAAAAAFLLILLAGPGGAQAQCSTDCSCESSEDMITETFIFAEANTTRLHILASFDATKNWEMGTLFLTNILPYLMDMAQQVTATAMEQAFIFGTYIDASNQIQTEQLFQELAARAHKDYTPSVGMCMIGTNVRSLASTERRGEFNGYVLNRRGQDRSNGGLNTVGMEGIGSDYPSRLAQFQKYYCDLGDNAASMSTLCKQKPTVLGEADRDIDFGGVMDGSSTLDLDFVGKFDPASEPATATKEKPTNDERDVLALASNLYGATPMLRITETAFNSDKTSILDTRSIMAQRSVAEASFYTIAGLKSKGTPPTGIDPPPPNPPTTPPELTDSSQTAQYMNVILQQLGVSAADMAQMIGQRPSYYAQMEVLTKKIYQNPGFYTDLYETPANTLRKQVALQAIGLMQGFDTLQSNLRTEMMLSQLLELQVIKLQDGVQNELDRRLTTGPKGANQ